MNVRIPEVEANPGQYDLFQVLEKIDTKVLLLFGDGSKLYDEAAIADLLGKRPEFPCIAGLRAGPRPSLMTYEQALLISGYLSS